MDSLTSFVTRNRWKVIIVWAILTVFGGYAAGQMADRFAVEFGVPGYDAYEANQRTLQTLGSGEVEPFIAVLTTSGDITLGVVTAPDVVTLTSAGAVTDTNAAAANVIATSLTASAATGIDTDTTITTLTSAAVSGAGNIDISDTAGGLAVTSATRATEGAPAARGSTCQTVRRR